MSGASSGEGRSGSGSGVALLVARSRRGDARATEELYRVVEAELRRLARGRLFRLRARVRQGGVEPSLETTQLLDDAFLSVVGETRSLGNRAHFFAIAACKMRSLCRDYARQALAAKRGGRVQRVPVEDVPEADLALDPEQVLAVDAAVGRLAALDPEQARVVELRFYGGLSDLEVAGMLGLSGRTVRRRWASARAFLRRELRRGPADGEGDRGARESACGA